MEQERTTHPLTHETLYRWFVWVAGKRKVTYAATKEAAAAKRGVERVEPAPPAF